MDEGAHQNAKFQTFDCSSKMSPKLYFDRLLLLKAYKISAKKVQRNYVSWHWRLMQNLNKNWCLVSKPTRTSWILTLALESQTNLHFDWCLLCKNINFDLKKYRGIVFHDTEEWYKIWRKTDLWFGKWHEEFRTFSPERSKVSKLGLWWDTFVQSRKCMSLKFTDELTIKNDAKFEEELTCYFKIGMRNLRNFDPGTRKSQKLAF